MNVEVGDELPEREYTLTRETLVRYAGASGDFNVIHWSESAAKAAGLPDVIAHGMLTMAQVARLVTDWTGDPGAVTGYSVRFSRPVVVPDGGGARIVVRGRVEERLDGGRVAIGLTATVDGEPVIAAARAVVRLG